MRRKKFMPHISYIYVGDNNPRKIYRILSTEQVDWLVNHRKIVFKAIYERFYDETIDVKILGYRNSSFFRLNKSDIIRYDIEYIVRVNNKLLLFGGIEDGKPDRTRNKKKIK